MKQLKFWYAVDLDGSAYLFYHKPNRDRSSLSVIDEYWYRHDGFYNIGHFGLTIDDLPKLTWEDEPIEITLNIQVT